METETLPKTDTIITHDQVIPMLGLIVDEFGGDYFAGGSYSFENGLPHCIVGVALSNWGVPTECLWKMDHLISTSLGDESVAIDTDRAQRLLMDYGFYLEPRAGTLLGIAQQHNDKQSEWEYVVDRTRKFAHEFAHEFLG